MSSSPRKIRIPSLVAVAALGILSACGSTESTVETESVVTDEASEGGGAQPGDGTETGTDPAQTDPPAPQVQQNSVVTVTGEGLAPFADAASDPLGVAPVAAGASFDGTPVSIGGPSAGPTLVVFLAHWCPHCNDEIPELNTLRDGGEIPDGLNVIGVSTAVADDRDNYPPSEWIVEKDWTWPVLADSEELDAFLSYGGTGFPFTVMLDEGGNVLGRAAGSRSAGDIDAWIDSLIG